MPMLLKQSVLLVVVCGMVAASPPIELQVRIKGDSVINSISDHFFGHNYWLWCPTWGNHIQGTASRVAELKVRLLRFGGIAPDVGYPDRVSNGVIADFNAYCQKIGAAPLFQVPLACFTETDDKQTTALAMVDYFKSLNALDYVSIGNEPDIYSNVYATNPDHKAGYLSGYALNDYCADYNAVASALKKKHPSLKIVGLDLSYNYYLWVPGFVEKCRDNIDMLSLHYYPFTAGQCSYRAARSQFDEMQDFYFQMRSLIDKNAAGKKIPLIIGETNISWDGEPSKSTLEASPGTFAAALWFADFVGVSSAQKNLFSMMPWSIREEWSLGFLGPRRPKPVFFVYKLFSELGGKHCIHIEKYNDFVRIYGYKDERNNVSIFTVNWDTVNCYAPTFAFTGALNDTKHTCTVPPFSISVLTLSSDAKEKTEYVYTKKLGPKGPVSDKSRAFKAQFAPKRKRFLQIRPVQSEG